MVNYKIKEEALKRSKFRASFKLNAADKAYITRIGLPKIQSHARDFITSRIAPKQPKNDGKQTPFKGHPVFKAQHATATCCRGCLAKWHKIPKNRQLTTKEIEFVVDIIMGWVGDGSPLSRG